MHRLVPSLILYRDKNKNSILLSLAEIFADFSAGLQSKDVLIDRVYAQIHQILVVSTAYGFDENLWQEYLTFYLITNENPFSLTCEKNKPQPGGSVNALAKQDFAVFMQLFHYDFSPIEQALGISCFSAVTKYASIEKPELMYNKNVSEKVRRLRRRLANAQTSEAFFQLVTDFYADYGVGMFGLNKAFRLTTAAADSGVTFQSIHNMDEVHLSDLVGYELQKKQLVENTRAFISGQKANNVLLFGDSGTGKSTSIKAVLNEFYDNGLRLIEIYKHQFHTLSDVISATKNRNYKFIIYMDDLSFEEFEIEYKFLKAVIEGGVETRPQNVLIYATSNRRHLIRETWNDRSDMETTGKELHRSDTMEEKLSLVNRFGVTICYAKPGRQEYLEIVDALAARAGICMEQQQLHTLANQWEMRHGGLSGRTAHQFITHLLSAQN